MDKTLEKELHDVVIRFSGDSGDGMQLTGTLFSDTSRSAPRKARSQAYRAFRFISATAASSTPATIATCWWR